jgi:hypothetical protein
MDWTEPSVYGVMPGDLWRLMIRRYDCVLLPLSRTCSSLRKEVVKELRRLVRYEMRRQCLGYHLSIGKVPTCPRGRVDRLGRELPPGRVTCRGLSVVVPSDTLDREYVQSGIRLPWDASASEVAARRQREAEERRGRDHAELQRHVCCLFAIARSRGMRECEMLVEVARTVAEVCPNYLVHLHSKHLLSALEGAFRRSGRGFVLPIVVPEDGSWLWRVVERCTRWLDERERVLRVREERRLVAARAAKEWLDGMECRVREEGSWVVRVEMLGRAQKDLQERKARRLQERSYGRRQYVRGH